MFAVIKTGGKQYRVAPNDLLKIEKISGAAGDRVEFGNVILLGGSAAKNGVTIGTPFVEGALVTAELVSQERAHKVIAFKKRRRQNSRRTIGHRQHLTTIRIAEIFADGEEAKKTAVNVVEKSEKAPLEKQPSSAVASKEKISSEAKETGKAKISDDVKLIGGIGPALEKKLEAAGITSLKEIAGLSVEKLAELDEKLKLGGRSARDEWIEQAKELLAGKPPRTKTDQKAALDKK